MGFVLRTSFEWKLRTRSLQLGERTRLMAIVNLTADSFSGDGLAAAGVEAGVNAAIAAVDGGADIVDLGAESTRPGAEPVREYVEQRRLLPVIEGLLKARPRTIVSVDTYHAGTAIEAAMAGAEIVNDVSGLLWDTQMAESIVATRCGLVLMHTRGRSWDWKELPKIAEGGVTQLVMDGLQEQLAFAQAAGVGIRSIVIDPGFGFGKKGRENFELLAGMARLRELKFPVLAGVSRKGFLGEAVKELQREGQDVQEARRVASVAGNVAAVLAGAHILRVHDLQEGREAAAIADAIVRS